MKQKHVFIRKRIRSFGYAIDGIKNLFLEEPNARIHLVVTFCVLVAGLFFRISPEEWLIVILAIGLVISMEAMNTAVENLADFVSPEKHSWIKKIKDLSAAAVLICALSAVAAGLVIFLPKLFRLI